MRLAIVGASARSACDSALRDGFEVVGADQFADRDLTQLCPTVQIENWQRDLPAWLHQSDADAWMYVGGMENRPDLVEELATCKPLLGTDATALRKIRDPIWLAAECERCGIDYPTTLSSPPSRNEADQWLCKPWASGGGLGICFANQIESYPDNSIFQHYVAAAHEWSALFCISSNSVSVM